MGVLDMGSLQGYAGRRKQQENKDSFEGQGSRDGFVPLEYRHFHDTTLC